MLMTSTTPHIFSPVTTRRLMWDVIIALLPAAVASVLIFGISALQVLITSIAACVMFEYLITRYFLKTANTIRDGSAIITGILLAFNLPSSMPAWMILIGAFVASGENVLTDTAAAVCAMGLCGEMAYQESVGTSTFRMNLIDQMSLLSDEHLQRGAKIELL